MTSGCFATGQSCETILSVADIAKSCVYCGCVAELTTDHIPPKSLFNRPRPTNLITVWACHRCNQGFSKDEDYFWLTLASRAGTSPNPEADAASLRAIQRLSRPQAAGFRSSFLKTVQSVEVKTASGLYIGDTLAYDVSFARLNRVAAKITRGLFCSESKALAAAGYVATARALDQFTAGAHRDSLRQLLAFVGAEHPHSIGRIFSYRFRSIPDDPQSSVALFDIYETTTFVGLTLKGQDNVWTEWV